MNDRLDPVGEEDESTTPEPPREADAGSGAGAGAAADEPSPAPPGAQAELAEPLGPKDPAPRTEEVQPPRQAAFKFSDDTLKALIEGIIYVAPEPVSLELIAKSLEGEERDRIKSKLEELIADFERPGHGIQIRQVAGGYKFSSKAEHHEVLRQFVKSLKPPMRLSRQALETLAVIAYRQPVTLPEIEEIRGVDCGGVVHTLLEKKLVLTAGRKNMLGRPILYRTSREFLVHFGLRDTGDLPSMKEFEELARQALGSDLVPEQAAGEAQEAVSSEPPAVSEPAQEESPPAGPSEAAPSEEAAPEQEASGHQSE